MFAFTESKLGKTVQLITARTRLALYKISYRTIFRLSLAMHRALCMQRCACYLVAVAGSCKHLTPEISWVHDNQGKQRRDGAEKTFSYLDFTFFGCGAPFPPVPLCVHYNETLVNDVQGACCAFSTVINFAERYAPRCTRKDAIVLSN